MRLLARSVPWNGMLYKHWEKPFITLLMIYSRSHAVYEPIIAGRVLFILINGKLGIPTNCADPLFESFSSCFYLIEPVSKPMSIQ